MEKPRFRTLQSELDTATIPMTNAILQRKGARKVTDIPNEVLLLLQKGQLETVNLTEWLAVDHMILLHHVLAEMGLQQERDSILSKLNRQNETKMMKIIPAIAREWLNVLERKPHKESSDIFHMLATHRSDSVRCWAAYIIGLNEQLEIEQKLACIRPFAADSHFGVREIAWMAVRESIANQLLDALDIFKGWVCDQDANIRRFAIESTRPHGVWAKHITELKENPHKALMLLEALKSDPSKYVQNSVGNWLNDASKTNPEWVLRTCEDWLKNSDCKDTIRMVTRAKRSLVNKNE